MVSPSHYPTHSQGHLLQEASNPPTALMKQPRNGLISLFDCLPLIFLLEHEFSKNRTLFTSQSPVLSTQKTHSVEQAKEFLSCSILGHVGTAASTIFSGGDVCDAPNISQLSLGRWHGAQAHSWRLGSGRSQDTELVGEKWAAPACYVS